MLQSFQGFAWYPRQDYVAEMRVSATESESDGWGQAMFLRWQKEDLVMILMWDWNGSVESRMTPRL